MNPNFSHNYECNHGHRHLEKKRTNKCVYKIKQKKTVSFLHQKLRYQKVVNKIGGADRYWHEKTHKEEGLNERCGDDEMNLMPLH